MLGHIAIGHFSNETLHLPGNKHPRGKLLKKLGIKKARKMYIDKNGGRTAHIGYICGKDWWTIYEVNEWEGGN